MDADGRAYDAYVQDPNSAAPLFYFGSGLSFTTFELADLSVTRGAADSPVAATVAVTVRNTGSLAGSTVVQVYVRDPIGASNVVRPWKRLVAFRRTDSLAAGASVQVTVEILGEDLAVHDDAMAFAVVPGSYLVSVTEQSSNDEGVLQQDLVVE